MTTSERWQHNWRIVSPAGAVRVDLRRSSLARQEAKRSIDDLPAGTPIVLVASAPRASARCRAFASDTRIDLEREYLAFPSADSPAYLVEDTPAVVRLFLAGILVVPPGTRLRAPLNAVLALVRVLSPSRLISRVAPGWVAVGRRT